jgi:hypothetical protein
MHFSTLLYSTRILFTHILYLTTPTASLTPRRTSHTRHPSLQHAHQPASPTRDVHSSLAHTHLRHARLITLPITVHQHASSILLQYHPAASPVAASTPPSWPCAPFSHSVLPHLLQHNIHHPFPYHSGHSGYHAWYYALDLNQERSIPIRIHDRRHICSHCPHRHLHILFAPLH